MNFAVFITTHGRADRVYTYQTLRRCGYKDIIYVVVDNEDKQLELYRQEFEGELLIYNKQKYIDKTEKVLKSSQRASVTYPRNAVEDYAKSMKLDAFAVFDDDITGLRYRWIEDNKVKSISPHTNIGEALKLYAEYMLENHMAVISFCHMMFYVSGTQGIEQKISEQREAYQLFIRNVHIDMNWIGVMRQDMLTNLITAPQGYIWWSIPFITYDATPMNETRENEGGMIDAYRNISEYRRSFMGIIVCPSAIKVGCGNTDNIKMIWNKNASVPKIISGRYKK